MRATTTAYILYGMPRNGPISRAAIPWRASCSWTDLTSAVDTGTCSIAERVPN